MATIYQYLDPTSARLDTANPPQMSFIAGTNFPAQGLAFDAAAAESAFWYMIARDYGSGNLTVRVYWYADTANSGDVRWQSRIGAYTPNTDTQDFETDGFGTYITGTDSHLTTTVQRLHSHDIVVTSLDGLATDDHVVIELRRDAADVGDTMAGDAIVVGVEVSYSDV